MIAIVIIAFHFALGVLISVISILICIFVSICNSFIELTSEKERFFFDFVFKIQFAINQHVCLSARTKNLTTVGLVNQF